MYYNLAPAQLIPNAWRILLKIEILTKELGIDFLVSKVINCYSWVENREDLGQYFFKSCHKCSITIDSLTSNKLLKNKYVFV